MTAAEQLIRQGKREGKRQGKREGKREGRSSILRIQLEARFGRLPAAALARLVAATDDDLDRWARAVLTAKTLGEALA